MSLSTKLLEVQTEATGRLGFDAKNPHFKSSYITLGKVLEVVGPLLRERDILLSQPLGALPAAPPVPALVTRLIDTESGEVLEDAVPLVLEKHTPQGLASAVTYFRRIGILSALGLVGDEDDDAEAAEPARTVTVPASKTDTVVRF